jgi:hypothetical protein
VRKAQKNVGQAKDERSERDAPDRMRKLVIRRGKRGDRIERSDGDHHQTEPAARPAPGRVRPDARVQRDHQSPGDRQPVDTGMRTVPEVEDRHRGGGSTHDQAESEGRKPRETSVVYPRRGHGRHVTSRIARNYCPETVVRWQ